ISVALTLAIGNFITQNKLGFVRHAPYDVYLDESNVFQPDFIFVSNENARADKWMVFMERPI
ncbi:MAG: hypothetical protein ABIQ74_01845, partial [Chitinophagales bacterium]